MSRACSWRARWGEAAKWPCGWRSVPGAGDWFDNCSRAVACPCTFAQAPDNGFCESVLFWHIRSGHFGDINLGEVS